MDDDAICGALYIGGCHCTQTLGHLNDHACGLIRRDGFACHGEWDNFGEVVTYPDGSRSLDEANEHLAAR